MSIRRNSNKGPFRIIPAIIAGIVFVIVLSNIKNGPDKHSPRPPAGSTGQSSPVETVNPIVRLLNTGADLSKDPVEGIAIGIAIDVSGSMNDSVPDSDGSSRRKIEIARRCALEMLKQADAFALAHPEQTIEAGIFEFSSSWNRPSCRQVVPFGPPEITRAAEAIQKMRPEGGTPIGDAIIAVKQQMNGRGLSREHLLVITDGANNQGYDPGDVVNALSRMPDQRRASVYFFAFDVSADKFTDVREAGGLVMAASNGQELEQTLGYVLTGKILVEQPEAPGAK